MSTHCAVVVKTEKGHETIYVHHDGYRAYMWPMLTNNYNSYEKAKELVSYGDASSIQERLHPTPGSGHSFDNPERDVCIFYHRDRGEDWNDTMPLAQPMSVVFKDFEYVYVFEDDEWSYYKNGIRRDMIALT